MPGEHGTCTSGIGDGDAKLPEQFYVCCQFMGLEFSLLRVAVPVCLYLFVLATVILMWCESKQDKPNVLGPEESVPGARLVVKEAGDTGMIVGDVILLTASTQIGRSLENTVILPDSSVSTRHATLFYHNGCWWLNDLNSTNGTMLNGESIAARTHVHPRDVITFGKITLAFEDNQNAHS